MNWYERAAIIPGRSLTRSKAPDRVMKAWATSAEGAVIYTSDGRELLDFKCGLGAISLGYRQVFRSGSGVYSLPHIREVEAAEAVLERVAPWATHVRFTKTGSEATHAAYRIAKAATGRKRVMVHVDAYHGWHEWFYEAPRFPNRDGEPVAQIAAIFIEPNRFGGESTENLKLARKVCDDIGALLVFDEMLYGGRWALGGATERFGVIPDLACYGKAFGNGDAVAFVVGRDALRDHGELASGTFSGDTVGLNAVQTTLSYYQRFPVIQTIWERGQQLRAGLESVLPKDFATVDGDAPYQRISFVNPEHERPFGDAMHERGILCHVQPLTFMTMRAHAERHIEHAVEAAAASCRAVRG